MVMFGAVAAAGAEAVVCVAGGAECAACEKVVG
jgi:hypothetical protein